MYVGLFLGGKRKERDKQKKKKKKKKNSGSKHNNTKCTHVSAVSVIKAPGPECMIFTPTQEYPNCQSRNRAWDTPFRCGSYADFVYPRRCCRLARRGCNLPLASHHPHHHHPQSSFEYDLHLVPCLSLTSHLLKLHVV